MRVVKNRVLTLIYRIVLVLICGYGLIINFYSDGKWIVNEQIRYFTILSNILVFICFTIIIINMIKNWKKPFNLCLTLKGITTMGISVTFLIFTFIIAPNMANNNIGYDPSALESIVAHNIVPIMVILDYFFFDDKGFIKKGDHFIWMIFPMLYFVYVIINAQFGNRFAFSKSLYPYDFIDIEKYGWKRVAITIFILLVAFAILGMLIYLLDKRLSKNHKKKITKKQAMNLAFIESLCNVKNNFTKGGPFGAVIVDQDGHVIATGHNTVLGSKDPTAHAEINAIRNACKKLETHDLQDCVLYTSCYPCPMCMSAIIWANIKEVYYGNSKEDADDIGFRDDKIYKIFKGDNKEMTLTQMEREMTIIAFDKFKKNQKKIKY